MIEVYIQTSEKKCFSPIMSYFGEYFPKGILFSSDPVFWISRVAHGKHTYKYFCCLVIKSCLTLATLWTVARQAPPSMGFCRQEYWSGLPFPSPGVLSDTGIKLASSALAGEFFTTEPTNYTCA